jgi:hypothetical protein
MDKPIKPTRRHALKIFDWCIEKYGISKYNRIVPIIEFRKGDYYTEGCMAFYDEIESTIFLDKTMHHDLYELASSIIHEYTHYKQNMRHYQILSMYLPDHKHPMEIEAYKIAKRDAKKCIKELFGDLTSK